MFGRIATALESIATSLTSIAADIECLRYEQERMIQQADQTREDLPRLFMEMFSVARKAIEEGFKNGS